jgi:hypothetical protein
MLNNKLLIKLVFETLKKTLFDRLNTEEFVINFLIKFTLYTH